MVPGILMTHIALGKLLDPLKNLPENIQKGFDDVLKFDTLEENAKQIKNTSDTAILKCMITVDCAVNVAQSQYQNTTVDVSAERDDINSLFTNSLNIVMKVANDKYFGVAGMDDTATSLNNMSATIANLPSNQTCTATIVEFCQIKNNADTIVNSIGDVNAAISSFTNNKEVDKFKDYSDFLVIFHAVPYIGVVALLFFTIFHWKGGVCCCCSGGSKCACLALFPFALFWLVSFVLFAVIIGGALAFKLFANDFHIDALKGSPMVEDVINHVQTDYRDFWNATLENVESGLGSLLFAAVLKTVINVLILLFTTCECCRRPFKKEDGDAEKGMK
jgi:hypothetical protein